MEVLKYTSPKDHKDEKTVISSWNTTDDTKIEDYNRHIIDDEVEIFFTFFQIGIIYLKLSLAFKINVLCYVSVLVFFRDKSSTTTLECLLMNWTSVVNCEMFLISYMKMGWTNVWFKVKFNFMTLILFISRDNRL